MSNVPDLKGVFEVEGSPLGWQGALYRSRVLTISVTQARLPHPSVIAHPEAHTQGARFSLRQSHPAN